MRNIFVGVLVALAVVSPVLAKQATIKDRQRLAVAIADYITDHVKSNPFKSKAVEVGTAVMESSYALAVWRSADGKEHGQVSFFYLCDSWNVGKVTTDSRFRPQDLTGRNFADVPSKDAARLVAELRQAEFSVHVSTLV